MGGFSRLHGAVASIAVTVLTFTLLTPVAAIASDIEADPTLVPPLVSEELEIPASTYPEDQSTSSAIEIEPPSAVGRAVGGTRPTVSVYESTAPFVAANADIQSQTEFTTTYRNHDGTETLEASEAPINARNDDGAWQPVETRVSHDDEGRWSTDAHPLDPSFASNAAEDDAFTISRGGYDLGFTLQGVADSTFSRVSSPRHPTPGDEIVYRDVYDDVDLTYSITRGAVKESLILHDVPSVGHSTWVWEIDSDGLDLVVDEFGSIRFVDMRGNVQVFVPAPTMWDSLTCPGFPGRFLVVDHAASRAVA